MIIVDVVIFTLDPKVVQEYYIGLAFPVHVYDVQCSGSEENLLNCTYNNYNSYYCSRYTDNVGVSCGKLATLKRINIMNIDRLSIM